PMAHNHILLRVPHQDGSLSFKLSNLIGLRYRSFMETAVAHERGCKCLKNTSSAFSPKQIKSLQVIPSGIRCQNTEIILTLRNNWKVCVNPKVIILFLQAPPTLPCDWPMSLSLQRCVHCIKEVLNHLHVGV
uniref:C-X-C motif chemokine n=1 Tax=Salvator merianae TaxID=96440 RepID=A0A8D0CAP7_SALMN